MKLSPYVQKSLSVSEPHKDLEPMRFDLFPCICSCYEDTSKYISYPDLKGGLGKEKKVDVLDWQRTEFAKPGNLNAALSLKNEFS